MNENKVILKNSIILFLKLFIVSIVGLITSKFLIEALGLSDFGLFSVVGSIVFIIAFLNNIMVSTTYRFIAFEIGREKINAVNEVFNVSLLIHIFLGFLIFVIAETVGVYYINNFLNIESQKIDDALFVFHCSVVGTVFSIVSVPFHGLAIAKERFFAVSIFEIIRSILALTIVFFILSYDGNKLRVYSLLITIISLIPSILIFIYCKTYFSSEIKWKVSKNKVKYFEMIKFSVWIMFGAAASASEIQVSTILINNFFGTIVNASYGIAFQINNLVKMFAQSISQSFIPQITKNVSRGEDERTFDLVVYTCKYSFFFILLPSIPIILETEYILKLWLNVVPDDTVIIIKIFIITAMLKTINSGIPAFIQAKGKIKYFQVFSSILTLSGLPISYLMFKAGHEPYALPLVFLLLSVIDALLTLLLLKKILNFNIILFIKKVYVPVLVISICLLPLGFIQMVVSPTFFRFLISSFVSLIYVTLLIYLVGMSNKEKSYGKRMILNILKTDNL